MFVLGTKSSHDRGCVGFKNALEHNRSGFLSSGEREHEFNLPTPKQETCMDYSPREPDSYLQRMSK